MVRETFSDNITLTPDKESDFVTEVNPGLSVNRQGRRVKLNLDYEMQNVFYAGNSDSNKINNYLRADGNAELVQDHLFLDGYGYVQPEYLLPDGTVGEGDFGGFGAAISPFRWGFTPLGEQFTSLNNNQTTAVSFALSPYWRQNLGGYATALARYGYGILNYTQTEGGAAPANARNNLVNLGLNSGSYFSRLEWDLQYNNQRLDQEQDQELDQELDQENANDNTYENASGQFRYRFSNKWGLVGQGGYQNNDVPDQVVVNGGYWSLGPEWTPSRYISAAALYGFRDWSVRLRLNPTVRTALELSRSDRQVGVEPGPRWAATLIHSTRHTTWSASYQEEPTSVQGVQFAQLVTVGQQQPLAPQPVFTPTNQNFFQKSFLASVTYQKGRSELALGFYDERREFIDPADNEKSFGTGLAWGWRLTPRTRTILGGQWQQYQSSADQWWVGSFLLEHNLSRYISGLLGYRYFQRELSPDNIQENRFQLGLQAQF